MNYSMIALLTAGALLGIARHAWADDAAHEPTYKLTTGSPDSKLKACRDYYYPEFEVRAIQDMPISVLITRLNGAWTVGPAAGLDALAIWWSPVRPTCHATSDVDVYEAPREGPHMSVILPLNASYTVFSSSQDVSLAVPDPKNPGAVTSSSSTVNTAVQGGLFSGGLGFLFTEKWLSGGHGNMVAIGFLARYGMFVANTGSQGLFVFGPAVNLSLY